MQKWEYAEFLWSGSDVAEERYVVFTSGERWEPIRGEDLLATLRRLGEERWELVSVVKNPKDYEKGFQAYWSAYWTHFFFKRPVG